MSKIMTFPLEVHWAKFFSLFSTVFFLKFLTTINFGQVTVDMLSKPTYRV